MKLKVLLAVIVVVLIAGVLAGIKVLQFKKLGAMKAEQPPETVSSIKVTEERWQGTLSAIASISAVQGVTITPDIPGMIREIAFESGVSARKGDLLVKLDTSNEEAQLRSAEAQAKLADLNAQRLRSLRSQNMVSQAELDQTEATLQSQIASADAIKATIEKKTIRAPFDGQLGIRQVNIGQYLETGKPVVSLQSLDPVYADFTLPQQDFSKLTNGMAVRLSTDAIPEKVFEGKLTAINPDVMESTRSVGLQATFQNPEHLLRPGMFARVEVLLPDIKPVLVVPATAVLSATFGDSVFVIESAATNKNKLVARQQFIRSGRTRGDFVVIETGLTAGQEIAAAGVFKLRNNSSVVINNDVQPKASTNPQPPDS